VDNGSIKVGTQKEVDFSTKAKYYQAKIGLPYRIKNSGVFVSWRFLKARHSTQSAAKRYGDAFLDRYQRLLMAMTDEPQKRNWFAEKIGRLLH
jgi:hypothetical protein